MVEKRMWLCRLEEGGREVSMSQLAIPVDVQADAEVRVYMLPFPFLPPSKNVYENWPPMWKSAAKSKWVKAIQRHVDEQMMPMGSRRVGLAATLVFPTKARRDTQNYAQALWHWVPDGLVKAGVLVDDCEGAVEIGPNWGIRMRTDLRSGVPKKSRERTLLAVTVEVGP